MRILFDNIPNGLIIFFQSYSVLEYFIKYLKEKTDWQYLNSIKRLFIDDKNLITFEKYQKLIHSKIPASLFSVMGGKLSEGINFSDDLGCFYYS